MADKGSNMKNMNLVIAVVASGVVFGGLGFWGGKFYSSNRIDDNFAGNRINNQNGRGMMTNKRDGQNSNTNKAAGNGMTRGGGMIVGEVSSIDGESMTVKQSDGSSKIIVLTNTTKYTISAESSREKLSVGTKIAVMGETTTDGSTTATSVELNPALRGQVINTTK